MGRGRSCACPNFAQNTGRWPRLSLELLRRQREDIPVYTLVDRIPNYILDVGADYVVVRSWNRQGTTRKILASEIEDDAVEPRVGKRRVLTALRDLADHLPSP